MIPGDINHRTMQWRGISRCEKDNDVGNLFGFDQPSFRHGLDELGALLERHWV
jgi:hypothetical protein